MTVAQGEVFIAVRSKQPVRDRGHDGDDEGLHKGLVNCRARQAVCQMKVSLHCTLIR